MVQKYIAPDDTINGLNRAFGDLSGRNESDVHLTNGFNGLNHANITQNALPAGAMSIGLPK